MTVCILVDVFSVLLALNYNVDRVDFWHLYFKDILNVSMFMCNCFTADNYVKMVYSESCIFLVTRKDVNLWPFKRQDFIWKYGKVCFFHDTLV